MPQHAPSATVRAVNAVPLQGAINLGASGSTVMIGNPGGPVIFSGAGPIVPNLYGGSPRSIVQGR